MADTLFPAGQVAMLPGGSFRAGTYSRADANIDVAPLPQGKERATVTHGLANVIWASAEHPGASLELVKFLAGEEAETILGESGATIPAYAGLQEPWLAANPDMNLQVFIDALDYGAQGPESAGRLRNGRSRSRKSSSTASPATSRRRRSPPRPPQPPTPPLPHELDIDHRRDRFYSGTGVSIPSEPVARLAITLRATIVGVNS